MAGAVAETEHVLSPSLPQGPQASPRFTAALSARRVSKGGIGGDGSRGDSPISARRAHLARLGDMISNEKTAEQSAGSRLAVNTHEKQLPDAQLKFRPQVTEAKRECISNVGKLIASAREHAPVPLTKAESEFRHKEAIAKLATPRVRGSAGEHATRRALAKEFEAYAQQNVKALLPSAAPIERYGPAAFGDIWHTAGEDGYKSAIFHAAVKCRELLQSAGEAEVVTNAQGGKEMIFKGFTSNSPPELARLHTALLLFEELCKVTSPMQDMLRFLMRELCHCIFDSFHIGADVLQLTPFFTIVFQQRTEVSAAHQRAQQAEQTSNEKTQHCVGLKQEVERLKTCMKQKRDRSADQAASFESVVDERNKLQVRLLELQEREDMRADELRETNAELSKLQGAAFLGRRDLEQARKDANATATQLKEQQSIISGLKRKIDDLHDALSVMRNPELADAVPAPVIQPLVELQHEFQHEISLHRKKKGASRKPGQYMDDKRRGVDIRRLLKVPLPNGGWQMVMKGSADDHGQGPGYINSSGNSHIILVSGECFAALSIAMGLPHPPDLARFRSKDADDLILEIQSEVQALADEHQSLLKHFRQLRLDLKETLKLIPEWNADELRGVLRSVLVLDFEEALLVKPPAVGKSTFVGLGEGEKVPRFLRYDGLVKFKRMEPDEVKSRIHEIWLAQTKVALEAVGMGVHVPSLTDYLNNEYFPNQEAGSIAAVQMQFNYNFIYAVRVFTTLMDEHEHVAEHTGIVSEDADYPPEERKTIKAFNPAIHFHAGAEILYRGLLGYLHEDFFHDQTAMLVSLITTLVALSERLQPSHWSPPDDEDPLAILGMAEFSAILRLFFPSKPREHMSALKQILMTYVLDDDGRALAYETEGISSPGAQQHAPAKKANTFAGVMKTVSSGTTSALERSVTASGLDQKQQQLATTQDADDSSHGQAAKLKKPAMVDVGRIFGVALRRGSIAEKENFLSDLIGKPTPFVLELRRQHLCECFIFVDRLQKGFRMAIHKANAAAGVSNAGVVPAVSSRQAEAAFLATDQYMTEDQRAVYLLRGFGRRLPDPPSADPQKTQKKTAGSRFSCSVKTVMQKQRDKNSALAALVRSMRGQDTDQQRRTVADSDVEELVHATQSKASKVHKLRRLLKERVQQLHEDGASATMDVFLRRLAATGVTKTSRSWVADVRVAEVVQEAGLVTLRPNTVTAPLEEFLSVPPADSDGDDDMEEDSSSALSLYRSHVEAGKDILELSVGYPAFALTHWLSSGL